MTQTEIWIDKPRQPIGTRLLGTEVHTTERRITYTYRVKAWWLPYYWGQLMLNTFKHGFIIQVNVLGAEPGAAQRTTYRVREEEIN